MRVGVTGSSGFIGTALVTALRQRGDEVVRFVRPGATTSDELVVRWDPTRGQIDDGDLRRVGGFDAVVNLAGAGVGDHCWTEQRKQIVLPRFRSRPRAPRCPFYERELC
jgi:NAD dependent epimerase/dehydratase family enzyme